MIAYIITYRWDIVTGILLAITVLIFCLVQDIIEKKEAKEKIKGAKK